MPFVYLGDKLSIGEEFEGTKEFGNFYWICKNGNVIEVPKKFFEVIKENKGMDFHTKYSIGDKVFPIYKNYKTHKEPCSICEGNKSINLNGKEYICAKCRGQGEIYISTVISEIEIGQVGNIISVTINQWGKNEVYVEYRVNADMKGKSFAFYKEEDLFLSEQEALDECNRRNKK
jgi:hypothetical protein